jgi:hypothetical protein
MREAQPRYNLEQFGRKGRAFPHSSGGGAAYVELKSVVAVRLSLLS